MQRRYDGRPKSTMAGWIAVLIMIFQLIIQQINTVRTWKNAISIKLNLPHITITLLITLIVAVILSLYLTLHYISISQHKFIKKDKKPSSKLKSKKIKPKIEKPVVLPPKVELLKILNLIDEIKSITKETLIIELKYSNKIAKKYLKQLLKAEYIKLKPVYKSLIKRLFPFIDNAESKYIIDINGQQFLIDIAIMNMQPPYVGNRS